MVDSISPWESLRAVIGYRAKWVIQFEISENRSADTD